MPNMSYCRFENTYKDLLQCHDEWDDAESEGEKKYRAKLLKLCQRIVDSFEEDE